MEAVARRVIDELGAALLIVDAECRIAWANPGAESILGGALAGIRLNRSVELEERSSLLAELAGRLARGAESEGPALLVAMAKSGPRYLWMTQALLSGSTKSTGDRIVMLQDITGALTESPALRKVFSQVSHDLKSPLTSISGACELLGSGRLGALEGPQKRLIAIIEEGTRRMGEILDGAKDRFVRAETAAGGGSGE